MSPPKEELATDAKTGPSADMRIVSESFLEEGFDHSKNMQIKEVDDETEKNIELFGLHEQSTIAERLLVLMTQAWPVIVSFCLSMGGSLITLFFAARFVPETTDNSSTLLAGVNLANLFANVSCFSLLIGMSSAVETMGSQRNGAKNYRGVGIVLQKSCAILATISIPTVLVWLLGSYDLFHAIGVEHRVCVIIAGFLNIRALAVPIDVVNFSYEKYLMSIGVVRPTMWANVAFIAALVIFNSIFIVGFGLGYHFLAVSYVLSDLCLCAVQIGLCWNHPSVQRTLQPLDWEAWQDWSEFIILGIPGTIMLCSEWWAFEFLTLFATRLGTEHVAAQTVVMQLATLLFMFPMGFGIATASIIGNTIGAKMHTLAIRMGKLSLSCTAVLEITLGITVFFLGSYFVGIFIDDPAVADIAESAIPSISIFTTLDGVQAVSSGILRGAGKQYAGAVANVMAFYGIGLPLAWLLCFDAGFGVAGLIMGITGASLFQVIVLLTLILGFESYLYGLSTLSSLICCTLAANTTTTTTATHIHTETNSSNSNSSVGSTGKLIANFKNMLDKGTHKLQSSSSRLRRAKNSQNSATSGLEFTRLESSDRIDLDLEADYDDDEEDDDIDNNDDVEDGDTNRGTSIVSNALWDTQPQQQQGAAAQQFCLIADDDDRDSGAGDEDQQLGEGEGE